MGCAYSLTLRCLVLTVHTAANAARRCVKKKKGISHPLKLFSASQGFAAAGAKLFLVDRDAALLKQTAASLNLPSDRIATAVLDISAKDSIAGVLQQTQKLGTLKYAM